MNTSPAKGIDRHIDLALRREPDAGPPPGFARGVASQAARISATDARMERWLLRGLALVFAVSALAVVALYGRGWLDGFVLLLPATALSWMLALLACVGLSWSFERLRVTAHRR